MIDNTIQINTAMGLTKQKDGYALSKYLIDAIKDQLSVSDVCIFEIFNLKQARGKDGSYDLNVLSVRLFDAEDDVNREYPPSPEMLEEVIQRMTTTQLVCDKDDKNCIAIPITSDNGPLRIVFLDNVAEDPEQRMLALQLAELYGNQIALMDSKERDLLTGLLNRQTFDRYFELTMQYAKSHGQHVWLAILDIDHFKKVNDTYGHLFGDEVLLHFAQLMEKTFRYTDSLFRFGGEEFIVLMSTPTEEGVRSALERFRESVENYNFPGVGQVTVSIGYRLCAPGQLPTTITDQADQALYHAKETGRNQVIAYEDLDIQDNSANDDQVDLF